jgi:hypothetical protein
LTDNGDVCHYNIYNLSQKEERSFIKSKLTAQNVSTALDVCDEILGVRKLQIGIDVD